MLPELDMSLRRAHPSPAATPVLLIEADLDARERHEQALRAAGYPVLAVSDATEDTAFDDAAILVTDVPTFHWLQGRQIAHPPPMIVLTSDEKAGVTACLCGAAAWVPVDSDDGYLVDELDGVLRPRDVLRDR
jgi:hypothetical protein